VLRVFLFAINERLNKQGLCGGNSPLQLCWRGVRGEVLLLVEMIVQQNVIIAPALFLPADLGIITNLVF
jgi:hypothetical protein